LFCNAVLYDWYEKLEPSKNAEAAGFNIAASVERMLATPAPPVDIKRVVWNSRICAHAGWPIRVKTAKIITFFIKKNVENFSL
jgi:hypothetical protein